MTFFALAGNCGGFGARAWQHLQAAPVGGNALEGHNPAMTRLCQPRAVGFFELREAVCLDDQLLDEALQPQNFVDRAGQKAPLLVQAAALAPRKPRIDEHGGDVRCLDQAAGIGFRRHAPASCEHCLLTRLAAQQRGQVA